MRVDPFRHITASMAENAAFCRLVCAGIIKQRRHRVPAVMRSMAVSADEMHDGPPYRTVPPVVVWTAVPIADKGIAWTAHAGLDERCDAMMYRDDTDAGGGLALCDADIALSEMDICFL